MKILATILFGLSTLLVLRAQEAQDIPERVYSVVKDTPAEFPGGVDSLIAYVKLNLQFPKIPQCVEGRVYVQFIVELDGSLSNILVRKGIEKKYDMEAVKVFQKMPKWIPANMDSTLVRHQLVVPVKFY